MAKSARRGSSRSRARTGAHAKAGRKKPAPSGAAGWFVEKAAKRRGKPLHGKWRTVVNVRTAKLVPYGLQGKKQTDLTWHNVSYDEKTGQGVFLIRLAPGAISIPHEHIGFEEFFMIEGSIIDSDGAVYKAGDFVSLKPGSKHFSYAPHGAYALVILRGGKPSRTLKPGERLNIR